MLKILLEFGNHGLLLRMDVFVSKIYIYFHNIMYTCKISQNILKMSVILMHSLQMKDKFYLWKLKLQKIKIHDFKNVWTNLNETKLRMVMWALASRLSCYMFPVKLMNSCSMLEEGKRYNRWWNTSLSVHPSFWKSWNFVNRIQQLFIGFLQRGLCL